MKREVAAEIVDSLKEAGVDFVATLDRSESPRFSHGARRRLGDSSCTGDARGGGDRHLRRRLPGRETAGNGDDERRLFAVDERFGDGVYSSGDPRIDVDRP